MLLEFSITNFRSIKDRQTFSMLTSSRVKERHNAPFVLENYDNTEVLKTAVLYGKNNAGKSNVLEAFKSLCDFITSSDKFKIGEPIKMYNPFVFDKQTLNQNTIFEINFISNQIYYSYEVEFSKKEIFKEKLCYYRHNVARMKSTEVFSRENNVISYKKDLNENKKRILDNIAAEILNNQLLLSVSSTKKINEHFENAYLFFSQNIKMRIFEDEGYDRRNTIDVPEILLSNILAKQNIENLLIAADTGILGIDVKESNISPANFNFPDSIDEDTRNKIIASFIEKFKYEVKIKHRMFDGEKEIEPLSMPLQMESLGTKKMFTLGAIIHEVMQNGEVLIVDELDSSLHPLLMEMLVRLFYDKDTNPNNAQLIFSTHDTTLIDAYVFDRDQINLVDKDYFCNTEIIAVSDFKGLRADTPIGLWYMQGKLRGVPKVKEIRFQLEKNEKK